MSDLTQTIKNLTENPVLWDDNSMELLIEKARQAAIELEEWQKLQDPKILHTNLLRSIPANLSVQQLMHIAGERWHVFGEKYPSINQCVIVFQDDWKTPKIMMYIEPFIFENEYESIKMFTDKKVYWKELPELP